MKSKLLRHSKRYRWLGHTVLYFLLESCYYDFSGVELRHKPTGTDRKWRRTVYYLEQNLETYLRKGSSNPAEEHSAHVV